MRRMKTTLITTAFLLLAASPALAHAHLVTAVPANAAIVAVAPTALTLSFSEGVALSFTGITLTGLGGAVALGAAHLEGSDGTVLVVPLATALPPGPYTVAWHALSTDGHKTSGSYGFTVK
jgi:hypothetical protein